MNADLVIPAIGFGVVTASILAVGAVGFTLQFSVTNILNLAFGSVMTIAGFTAYALNARGVNIWICLIVAGLAGGLLSVALNALLFAPLVRRGMKLFGMVIVTISVALILDHLVQAIVGPSFFSYQISAGRTIHLGAMAFTTTDLITIGIALAAMLAIHVGLRFTRLGKAMRAVATDPLLARACGIRTHRVVNLAWFISGGLAGIAGVTLFIDTATFSATTGTEFLVIIIAAAVLGGVGHAYGAMLGALVVGIVSEVAAAVIAPSLKEIAAFVLLVLVLLIRPRGILAEVAANKDVVA
jgi:branched-chain amino acid transport system permease protein/neutral amino acid transport system permease protein